MNYQQEFQVNQTYQQIIFFAYDIVHIERYEVGMESVNYVAECQNYLCPITTSPYGAGMPVGSDECHPILQTCPQCIKCETPHFDEVYIDGFHIDTQPWEKRPYIATIQRGIRVPVTEEVYNAWKQGWESGGISSDVKPVVMYSDLFIRQNSLLT